MFNRKNGTIVRLSLHVRREWYRKLYLLNVKYSHSKSEHSQLEHSDIIPETMNEVEKVDKALGFFPVKWFEHFESWTIQSQPEQEVRKFQVGIWNPDSGFWGNNPNKDFYKDTIDGFLLGCGLAGIQIPIFNVMTSSFQRHCDVIVTSLWRNCDVIFEYL